MAEHHLLHSHHLPGLNPMRLVRLNEAGVHSLETLVATPVDDLASLPGFSTALAERLQQAANHILLTGPPPLPQVVEATPPDEFAAPAEPFDGPEVGPALRRGLHIARRAEETRSGLRTLRVWLKSRARASKADQSAYLLARSALKRLLKTLTKLQREAITHGLELDVTVGIDATLEEIDTRSERFASKPPTRKRLLKLESRMLQFRARLKAHLT